MAQTKLYCSKGKRWGFGSNLPHEHQRRTWRPAPLSPKSSVLWWRGGGNREQGDPQRMAMGRSRVLTIGLALAAGAMLWHPALAQSPFPPPPQQSSPFPPPPQQSSPFPPPPRQSQLPADSTSPFPAPSQQSVFPSGPSMGGPPMGGPPMGGPPPQSGICANFPKLRDEAKARAEQVSLIGKKHGDRKEMCVAVQNFTAAEE